MPTVIRHTHYARSPMYMTGIQTKLELVKDIYFQSTENVHGVNSLIGEEIQTLN